MCGICGVLNLDGAPVEAAVLEAMTARLHHRGPDESAVLVDGAVGLGHNRLRVIDLSPAARQPMANEDGTVQLVFNGEVYNYRELRARLLGRGHVFRSRSDTEVVVHLWEEAGERCVEELDGMFAFALWDARAGRLFLARDRVGKKPLFHYRRGRLFAFASEVKAFFPHPGFSAEVDAAQVAPYFLHGYVPGPATLYRGVEALAPGHTMTLEAGGTASGRRYWDLTFAGAGNGAGEHDERDAVARVRELVTDAVRKRLVADVPVGAFLSGGIDSSIVVGVMSRLLNRPVKTFSIGFAGDPAFDETAYARLAARRFGTDHTEFVVEPRAIDLLEGLVWHHDGPFGDSSAIPTYVVSQLTRQHVTVALNGDGGDELFAGYLRFQAGVLVERVPSALMRAGDLVLSLLPEPRNYHSPLRRAQRFFRVAASPLYERFARWIAVYYDDVESVLAPGVLAAAAPVDRIADYREHLPRIAGWTPLQRLLYLNFKTYLADDLLVKMDRTSMANSLEARSPFLDTALIEYVATLPDGMKLRRGRTKHVLRRAFADLLPGEILGRGKQGFGVPLGAWFRGALRDYVRDLLLGPDARAAGYVNQAYLARLVDEHLAGRRDHGHRLWAALTFEVWLRALGRWTEAPAPAAALEAR